MAGREYVSKFQLVVDPEEQRRRDAIAQGIVQDELTTAIDAGDARSASHLQQERKNRFSGKTGVAPTFTETPAFASETSAPSSTPDGWTVIDPGWTRKKPQAATPSGWEDVSSQFYYAGAQPKEQQPDDSFTGSMARGIKKTIPELKQAGAGAIAYLGDVFGAEGVKEWGLNKYHEIEDSTKNLQSANDSFSKVVLDGEGSFKAWLGNAVGYSIGQVGLALVSGGVGAIGGKMIAKQGLTKLVEGEIAKSFEKNVAAGMAEEAAKAAAIKTGQEVAAGALIAGRNTGAFTAAFLQNETQELGSIYNDAVEQAKKEGRTLDGGDLFRIGASSLAAAGVDTAMEAVNFSKITKGGEGSTLAKRAAVEIPSGMASEGVTEAIQTGIEQYGAGKPLDTREIIDSAALGAVGGGMGGAGASLHQRTAKDAETLSDAATLPVTPVVTPEEIAAIPQAPAELSPREQRQQAVADKLYPLPTQRETAPTADRQLEAINAINPLPEQRDGTIGVRQTPFTDAEIAAGVERAQAPARAIEEAYRLNEREQQDAAFQQGQQPQGKTPLAFNEAAAAVVKRSEAEKSGKVFDAIPPNSTENAANTPVLDPPIIGSDAKHGFQHGPDGTKYRIGVSDATGGTIALEMRYPAGTIGTFYVTTAGTLIDADGINLISDQGKLWVPKNEEQSTKVQELLRERAQLALTDPKRKTLLAAIREIVTNTQPNNAPILSANGQPFATLKAAETSIKARGLSGAVAVSVKGGGFGIRMAAPDSAPINVGQASPQAAAIALGARTLKKGDTVELDDGGSFTIDGAGPMKRSNPDGPWIYNVIWDNGKNAAFDDAEMSQQLGPQPYRSADFEQKYSAPAVVKRSAAAQKQQVVAPVQRGDTQAAADAISEAEYEHYKQTGEPGFGWADGFDEAASRIEALTDDDLEFAASDKPDTPQSLRDGMASLGFTQQEIDDEVTARFGQAQASAQSVAEPTASTAQSTGTSGTQAPPAAEVNPNEAAAKALESAAAALREVGKPSAKPTTTAEDAIRAAANAVPNRTIGSWYPITVEFNGVTQQFLSNIKRVVSDGKTSPAIHLLKLKIGRLVSWEEARPLVNGYRLTSANQLVEEGIPRDPSEQELARWEKAFGALESARPALDLTNPTESKLRTDDAKQKRDAAEKAAKENAPSPEEFGLVGSNRAADVGAAAGQNSLFQNTASYGNNAANENEAYATDLFGDPVPSATRAPRADSAKRPALRRDAQPKPALRDTERPDGEYLASTIVGASGDRELGVSRILTAEHAAAATRYLYRSAVERFDAIVTDKNGKPLAVVGGFKGAPTQTAVYPSVVIAEAMRVPGAANIWLSHNHPSGSETLSNADIRLESTFSDALRGSGIQHMGLLAVAGDLRYSHVYDGNITKGESRGPGSATISVPVIERELADNRIDKVSVNAPDIAKQVARDFYEKSNGPGVILLDAQHKLLGWMTITPNMYGALRGKSGGLNAIYRALSHSGAVSGIIAHGGELDARIGDIERVTASQNIAAALSKVDVSPLDSINVKTGKSVAMIGDRVAEGPLFSRSDTIEVDGQQRPRNNSNGKPIAATDDMFADDFANKRSKVDTGILADSKGGTIKGGNTNSDGKAVTFIKQGLAKFWSWFGASVAVDVKNRPLVLYHSTNQDVAAFKTGVKTSNNYGLLGDVETTRAAIFVTPERDFSQEYLRDGGGKNVMQVYASLQNPIDLRQGLSESDERALESRGVNINYIRNIQNDWELFDNDDNGKNEFVDALKALDFDGAIFYETGLDGERHKTYAVFFPNQLKSATGNTGQFSPDNADIRFSREAPLWRSTLTEAIGKTSFAQAPADQWKAWLNANAAKLGVKKDEIEWSGVTDWLDLQKGKVTRDQVREFLDANGVKVTETMLADGEYEPTFVEQDDDGMWRVYGERANEGDVYDTAEQANAKSEEYNADIPAGPSKYSSYQLPGGTNYRELLLTLPKSVPTQEFRSIAQMKDFLQNNPRADLDGMSDLDKFKAINKERRKAGDQQKDFQSSHWDQPNILAHIRFNERTDADGKRVLFIEEIQSDWGQAGKKQGFQNGTTTLPDGWTVFKDEKNGYYVINDRKTQVGAYGSTEAEAIKNALGDTGVGLVPRAPFVGKTEAWVSLALKRMIRYAVDNGFDRIAMVNGEQSAERYDLSKQVDSIEYRKHSRNEGYQISGIKDGTDVIRKSYLSEKDLEGMVGKDVAAKIINGEGRPVKQGYTSLSGVDLKVGGEGMKAFYDRIVPQVANDVLKKLGGGKLGVVELQIPGQEAGERDAATGAIVGPNGTRGKNFDAAGFDITPAMREHAAQGMPLFRRDEQQPTATNTHAADVIAKAAKTVNIPLDVYATPREASAKLGIYIPSDVRGLLYRGRAALISSNITTRAMGEFVLWHELFHAGITLVAPRYSNEYNRIMQDMAARNSNIIKAARDWRNSYGEETIKRSMEAGLSQEQAEKRMRLMAIEEAIADLAGANIELKGWTQFVAKLQALLRSMGFDNLANWIEGKSNAEVLQLIARTRDEVTTQNLHLTTQVPAFARDENDASYQRAYHGTPHKFDKFSLDKIGTGEGAQAYGYGLYFASKREIAEHYRNALGRPDSAGLSRAQDLAAWAYSMQSPYAGDAMEHLNDEIARMERHGKFNDKVLRSDYEEAKRIVASGEVISNGRLYQVDIPEDSEMLHWDKPLSEQPEAVKVALEKGNPALFQKNWYDAETKQPTELGETSGKMLNGVLSEVMDGSEYYRSLSSQTGGGAQASTKLRSLGIRGIKYLDGGSRNAGDGSYNYVVFDDKDVSIEAVHSRADDVSAIQRKIAQQESFNAQRAEKLPADHPLVSTGKRALARLQQELADAKEKSAGFDRWFEGSKAVDARGSPLVLYHGTSNDFSTFRRKTGGRAIWAADTETANSYAGESDGSNVMPVYMAMRNPLTVNADGATWQDLWFEGERLGADHLADIAEERGHDGLIIRDLRDHDTDEGGEIPADHYAVFKPTQVKSATGNTGAFSPDNADIRFSRSEQETETLPRGALTDKLLALRAVPDKLNRPHVYKVLALINEASKSKTLGSVAVFDAAKAEMKSLIEQANALTDNPSLKGFVGGQWGSVPKQKAVQPIARASSPKPSIALSAIDGLLQKADQTTDISERLDTALDAMKYAIRNGSAAAEDLFWQARDIAQSVVEEANSKLESEFLASGVFQNPENLMRNRDIIEIIRNGESPQWGIRDHSASFDRTTLNIVSSGRWSIDRLTNTADFQSANEQTTSQDGDVAFSRTGSGDIFDKNATAAQSTYNGTEAVQGMGMSVKNVMRQTANIARDKRGAALSFLGGRQIADIYSKDVPELPKYNEILQRMQAEQNEGSAVADSIIEKWRVINRKRPDVATQLSSLMHDSTLAQVDPDVSADNAELRKRWINLPQEAKDIYREARDAYVAHFEKVKAELIDRVERSALDTSAKNRTLASMREEFTKAMKGVYFPLARFGDYMVVVKDKAGVTQSVSMAETTNQAQALRAELLRAYPDYIVGAIQKKKEFNAERDGVSRGFMKDLVALISEEPDAQTRDSQLDAINQLWLSSLPDLSWAKSGIHRKGTPGYSNDAMRAFARNMFHGGYHLAKLRYGDRLGDTLAQMQETIDNKVRSNPEYSNVVAQSVVDEMNARHKHVMNPQNTPVANALTGLGFMWHMGLSPASAVVNLSQTALVAYPMLASKFGFGKAATMLLSLSADAVKGKNDLLSQLQGAEKDAYDRAVREGLIDVTMAHDLAGVSQGKSGEFNEKQQRVMRVASVMFHEAEKFNRGVTFMSAYRLAVQSGVSDPYKLAHDLTFDSHFDYSSQNRPRVMQGPTARVILLFKQYGQNMIYTLSRNTFKALQGDREAQKTLAGLLAMHGMFAGALGLPLMTTLLAAASAIGGSDDEPWDAQVALRNYLADVFGKDIGEVLAHGVFRAPGIKDAIGADISGRVGLDSMLIRMPQETLEGKKYYQALLETIAGPVFGIGGNIANGMQTMAQGNTLRGIEEMLPKSIKDPLKAYRYEQDGIQDKTGITIVDETTIPEEVAQFLGFSPARGMEGFEGKSAIKNQETLLTQRRRQLMQRYGKDAEEGDTADSLTAIQRWNIANPTMAIKGQDLLRSMREKAKRQAEAENGAYLSKKRRGLAELGEFANAE